MLRYLFYIRLLATSLVVLNLPWTNSSTQWCTSESLVNDVVQATLAYAFDAKSLATLEAKWSAKKRSHARQLVDNQDVLEAFRAVERAAAPMKTLMKLLPLIGDVFDIGSLTENQSEPVPLSKKMRKYAEAICSLSDLEIEGESASISCALMDLAKVLLYCKALSSQVIAMKHLVDPTSAECAALTEITNFPKEICYVSPRVYQQQQDWQLAGIPSPAIFFWNAENLHIPIVLHDFLASATYIPKYIPEDIREKELLSYLTLYRALRILAAAALKIYQNPRFLQCPKLQNIIPGWATTEIIYVRDKDEVVSPFIVVSQAPVTPCHVAIGIRGSVSAHELMLAADFTPKENTMEDGPQHDPWNVSSLFNEVHSILINTLEKFECACEETLITTYGHSLGASIAQLIAQKLGAKHCGRINGVFFSPVKVFTSRDQRNSFILRVNARTLIDISDPLYHWPCSERNSKLGLPRCHSDGHIGKMKGTKGNLYLEDHGMILLDVNYSEAQDNSQTRSPNIFDLISEDAPFVSTVMSAVLGSDTIQAFPRFSELLAAHSCSHACALSSACISDTESSAFRWWCQDCPFNS